MEQSSSASTSSRSSSSSPVRKQPHLEITSQRVHPPPSQQTLLYCDLPPHRKAFSFSTYEAYETHYNSHHTNRCLECQRNFPSTHFLDLHIAENHDTISDAKRALGEKTYACFVEDCDRVCSTPLKRRMHLVDKHFFPKNYDFFVVNDGIDGRKSLLRSPKAVHQRTRSLSQSSASIDSQGDVSASSPEAERPRVEQRTPSKNPRVNLIRPRSNDRASRNEDKDGIDTITQSMSSLSFIPSSVRFGRRRTGIVRQKKSSSQKKVKLSEASTASSLTSSNYKPNEKGS